MEADSLSHSPEAAPEGAEPKDGGDGAGWFELEIPSKPTAVAEHGGLELASPARHGGEVVRSPPFF